MPRNKYPEQTRRVILQTSERVFASRGYDNTKMQDIIDALEMEHNISKGAIYHHFKNKEAILDSLLDEYYCSDEYDTILQDTTTTGLDKLKRCMGINSDIEFVKVAKLKIPRGALNTPYFLHSYINHNQKSLAPLITSLIEEGVQDGSIACPSPKLAAELLLFVLIIWGNTMMFPLDEDEHKKKLHYIRELLLSIGLPILDDEAIDTLVKLDKIYNSLE